MSKKITDLAALTTVADNDLIIIEDVSATATKKITRQNFLLGVPVQVALTNTSAVGTTPTIIPVDDTIPQNTEGAQFISLAFTPKFATSTLVIEVLAVVSTHIGNHATGALFQDTTVNALTAGIGYIGAADELTQIKLEYYMVAGTTSATTFKFRAGPAVADTLTINGSNGGRVFSTIPKSYMKITEYAG